MSKSSSNAPIGYIWNSDLPLYQKLFPDILWKPALITTKADELIHREGKKESSSLTLISVPFDSIPTLSMRGLIQPVDALFTPKQLNRYIPLALKLLTQDGRLYGIPEDLNAYGLCFHHKHNMSKKITAPNNWEELLDTLAILEKENIVPSLHISLNQRHNNLAFIWSLFHSNKIEARTFNLDLNYNKKRLTEIYDFMEKLIKFKEVIPENSLKNYFSVTYKEKVQVKPVFFMGWLKILPLSMREPQSTTLLAFPPGPSGGQTAFPVNGTAWVIPKTSKHRDLAIKTLLSIHESSLAKLCQLKGGLGLPILNEFWEDKEILKSHPLMSTASFLYDNDTKVTGNCWTNNVIKLDYSLRNGLYQNISSQQWYNRLVNSTNVDQLRLKNTTIQKTLLFINQNLNKLSNLGEIAQQVSLSTNHLNRLFKNELGSTCWDYVVQLRMEKAKGLILDTSLSMKEIYHQLGFKDASTFSRTFHHKFGVTPSWFRKHPAFQYDQ